MSLKKIILIIPLIVLGLIFSCSDQTTDSNLSEITEGKSLISDIQKAVDVYFAIEEKEEFIKSSYTGTYNEPIIGEVYEFVITTTTTDLPEFNYLVKVSYDEGSHSINVVKRDFYILTEEKDVDGWIEKRLKLNEAKSVK